MLFVILFTENTKYIKSWRIPYDICKVNEAIVNLHLNILFISNYYIALYYLY